MKLVEFVPPVPHPLWELCPQMGITDVIVKVNPDLTGLPDPWRYETLAKIVGRLADAGLKVVGLEGDPFDMSPIKEYGAGDGNSRVERVDHVEKRRVLFVSRMHPKKGVMELVEAWGRLVVSRQSSVVSGWECELVYTVSGELEKEYEAKVKARVKELGLEDQFIFTGALNDEEKWEAYARADLFVLPTYSENFGIVVAEALWAGVPVITTKGTPWQELETWKCGKWIDLPEEGSNPADWSTLVSALEGVMLMSDDERREMGERGRKLVEEKYTWNACVMKMKEGYRMLTNGCGVNWQ